MSESVEDAWTKELEDARAALRKRFPDLRCLRCGRDDFVLRMWPDESLVPGLAPSSDNRVVELICENCGFQEKHIVRLLTVKEMI
jgi:hypothetical protein